MSKVNGMRKKLLANRIGEFDNIAPDDLLQAAEETEQLLKNWVPVILPSSTLLEEWKTF